MDVSFILLSFAASWLRSSLVDFAKQSGRMAKDLIDMYHQTLKASVIELSKPKVTSKQFDEGVNQILSSTNVIFHENILNALGNTGADRYI